MHLIPFDLIYGKRPALVSPAAETSDISLSDRAVVALAILALLCGAFFRFDALGHKLYTNDEATTSVHVSGHTIADYTAAAAAGRILTAGDMLRYQHIDPATGFGDVARSLASEDPQHPPLFYVLERGWEGLVGTSVAARRSLPALFGVLGMFAAFWFGRTLLRLGRDAAAAAPPQQPGHRQAANRFGLVLAVLVAVSPFHIVYAQQAREYSLWSIFVFAGSAALLRALPGSTASGRPDWRRWALFAALTAGGLYTDVIYLYILPAQALYVVAVYRDDVKRAVLPFVAAAAAGLAAFAPWLMVLVEHAALITNNTYLGAPLPAQAIVLKWLFNLGAVFFDLDYLRHASAIIVLPILALAGWGVAQLVRRRPAAATYVLALGFVTAAAFVIPDLAQHESRSTAARYLIPTWIALESAVAFALYVGLRSTKGLLRTVAAVGFGGLLSCGILSASVSATHEFWWADSSVAPIGPMARAVRAARAPVTVIFRDEKPIWNFAPMELANEVPPQTRLQLLTDHAPPVVVAGGTTFLLDPSTALRRAVSAGGRRLTEVYAQPVADDLGTLRRATSVARARDGFVDVRSSLWRVTAAVPAPRAPQARFKHAP
ncbi:MAG: hypothetical protein M3R44_08315 [Candidatus Eremiobacteraeota bacterium]|nr:hypothetical protein [Candidatus Eremiobacteraeota bacterium]